MIGNCSKHFGWSSWALVFEEHLGVPGVRVRTPWEGTLYIYIYMEGQSGGQYLKHRKTQQQKNGRSEIFETVMFILHVFAVPHYFPDYMIFVTLNPTFQTILFFNLFL